MLRIYNTKTKSKQEFRPLVANKVSLYVCGITVYDRCHIGHARAFVIFDMVVRYLQTLNYEVTFVRNITDIDDKIIKKANKENVDIKVITKKYIQHMHEDIAALNLLKPSIEPKATDSIDKMLVLIQSLIENKHAYVGKKGDVYYKVDSFKDYGALAHKDLASLKSGLRVKIAEDKQNPLDFVLWKKAKQGEPNWPSPWGAGRPGWHIECSAMSMHYLDKTIDIHGGGADLTFPHHENERAQSEGATGKQFVNTWMHVGFVNINNVKMSKSLENFFTIEEVLQKYHPEVIRYFMIASHYRSPINYSIDNLESAKHALTRLYLCLDLLDLSSLPEKRESTDITIKFQRSMNDDFNTPKALSVLFDTAHEINSLRATNNIDQALILTKELLHVANTLGLLFDTAQGFLKFTPKASEEISLSDAEIETLIAERENSRINKNWAKADEIRNKLYEFGIILEDAAGATSWRRQ